MHNADHSGLSPSSLALFQSCGRKYFLKKVVKVPIDDDQEEDTVALNVGKAFHKVLEDTMHCLTGVTYNSVHRTVGEFLDADEYTPMIFAMLAKYKKMHAASQLKVLKCEVEIETPVFFGYVDVVLEDRLGGWWIGDMKTAASYSPTLPPTLPRHQQLNLYAAHADVIADKLQLDLGQFKGCRYRLVTKSKLIRKRTEGLQQFLERLSNVIKAMDFVIPKEFMAPDAAYEIHAQTWAFLQRNDLEKDEAVYVPNYANCTQYFRPCEFWSRCHGKKHSEMARQLSVIDGDS